MIQNYPVIKTSIYMLIFYSSTSRYGDNYLNNLSSNYNLNRNSSSNLSTRSTTTTSTGIDDKGLKLQLRIIFKF